MKTDSKNKFVPYDHKTFKKKSSSLKIFNNNHKRNSKTIKHILSDKNSNNSAKKSISRKSNPVTKRPKSKNSKKNDKENLVVKKEKTEISQPKLDTFVTKVKEEKSAPNKFIKTIEPSNKLIQNSIQKKTIPSYYMEGLHKAFIKRSGDYFSNLYRIHFNQSLQFINVKKGLNLSSYSTNGKLAYIPGGKNFNDRIKREKDFNLRS